MDCRTMLRMRRQYLQQTGAPWKVRALLPIARHLEQVLIRKFPSLHLQDVQQVSGLPGCSGADAIIMFAIPLSNLACDGKLMDGCASRGAPRDTPMKEAWQSGRLHRS